MRLKSFIAPTIHEAMQQVREELGDDAIIVSTQTKANQKGVRITAAIEKDDEQEELCEETTESVTTEPKKQVESYEIVPFLRKKLALHGVPNRLLEEILVRIDLADGPDIETLFSKVLDKIFIFDPLKDDLSAQPIMLVGPPGSGKTVTVAKLAANAKIKNNPICIVTMDTLRAGAYAQLSSFTQLMKIHLFTVKSPEELLRVVENIPEGTTILIDTPGVNPFDLKAMNMFEEYIDVIQAEPLLVAPAGGDPIEQKDLGDQFSEIGTRRVLATRIDTSRRFGALFFAAFSSELAFSHFGVTPHIANGLQPVSSKILSKMILEDQNPFFHHFNQMRAS